MNGNGETGLSSGGGEKRDAAGVASGEVLEARYRRLLILLPATYRERRGEEMLATLLDGSAAGERWPSVGEAASLVALATRLRVGAPGATRRSVAVGEVLRRTALAGLLAFGLWRGAGGVSDLVALYSGRGYYLGHITGHVLFQSLVRDLCAPSIYFGAFLALVLGFRRLGRFLAVLQGGLLLALMLADRWTALSDRAALLGVALVIAVAAGLGFHRQAPRLAAPGHWLAAMTAITGLVLIVVAVATSADLHAYSSHTRVVDTIERVAAGPLLPALAAGFGLVRARRSPVWPAALLMLGLPALLLLPRAIVIYAQGKSGHLFVGDLFAGSMWPGMAIDMLIADVVLAIALGWALHRSRARSAEFAA